jgi:hypothetical protein
MNVELESALGRSPAEERDLHFDRRRLGGEQTLPRGERHVDVFSALANSNERDEQLRVSSSCTLIHRNLNGPAREVHHVYVRVANTDFGPNMGAFDQEILSGATTGHREVDDCAELVLEDYPSRGRRELRHFAVSFPGLDVDAAPAAQAFPVHVASLTEPRGVDRSLTLSAAAGRSN